MALTLRKEFNILLLGQTGVGKSTFINGILNYASFQSIANILSSEVKYCIPTIFNWYHSDNEEYQIIVGLNEDEKEHQEIGKSTTQAVKSYLFEFGNVAIRIIDTPGFGDTGGIKKDEQICENLLEFLSVHSHLGNLHAIVFLLKPNENRVTAFFQYCMQQILSKLHKDASKNIVFVFTHTNGTDYKPGASLSLVRNVIRQIPDVRIPCSKANIFCLDNDCIKFLYAYCYNKNNLIFDTHIEELYRTSWKITSNACTRLIRYIKGLEPHPIENTILVNSVRSNIIKLQPLLTKILRIIDEAKKDHQKYEVDLMTNLDSLQELETLLGKPTNISASGKFNVVCRNENCRLRRVSTIQEACCKNCTAFTIGMCLRMSLFKGTCNFCGCNKMDHQFDNSLPNQVMQEPRINKNAVEERQKIINKLRLTLYEQEINIKKYEVEEKFIQHCLNDFAQCLDDIAILSDQKNKNTDGSNMVHPDEKISLSQVGKLIDQLKNLEMMGMHIREAYVEENIMTTHEKSIYIDPIADDWKVVNQM